MFFHHRGTGFHRGILPPAPLTFVEGGVGVVVAPVEPVVLESGDAVEAFALGRA